MEPARQTALCDYVANARGSFETLCRHEAVEAGLRKVRQWRIVRTAMRFVETPVFTAAIRRHLDDEHYRQLQIALMLRPEQGPVIAGAGGLRKIRWSMPGSGKRGGLRVIYYWVPAEQAFYMVYAYTKAEQGDLTPAQTRELARVVRKAFK